MNYDDDELEKELNSWNDYLNTSEGKRLMKSIQDEMDKNIRSMFTHSAMQTGWGHSPIMNHISPTDVNARGHYSYQEPEQDEQGTFYGYKVLYFDRSNRFVSPRYTTVWNWNGTLTSDREPEERTMHGIHFTKRPDHPELRNYMFPFAGAQFFSESAYLVKCALSGTVVETEQGFRAQHAQIIGVLDHDGNWKTYQDTQERSCPNPYEYPKEIEWRITYHKPKKGGSYSIDWNPSADS